MQVITKISPKTLKASPKMKLITIDGKQVPRCDGEQTLFRVLGRAVGVKTGTTDFGDFVAFTGDFRATVIATGEVFRSSKVFLPESVVGMLQAAMQESNAGVEFAFDIGAVEANTPTGYQYTVKSLIETPEESDPLANLLALVKNSAPALPAPVQATLPEVETVADAEAVTTPATTKKSK